MRIGICFFVYDPVVNLFMLAKFKNSKKHLIARFDRAANKELKQINSWNIHQNALTMKMSA